MQQAKGYPDVQSRQFLKVLSDSFPNVPILGLVDYDPDGLGILSTYKHGSARLALENQSLAVGRIEWLGIKSTDLPKQAKSQEILSITSRDRRTAKSLLERAHFQQDNEAEWRREVQVMLMLNMKAEIQILGNAEQLGTWLDHQLHNVLP